jgi:hypothetical protein
MKTQLWLDKTQVVDLWFSSILPPREVKLNSVDILAFLMASFAEIMYINVVDNASYIVSHGFREFSDECLKGHKNMKLAVRIFQAVSAFLEPVYNCPLGQP